MLDTNKLKGAMYSVRKATFCRREPFIVFIALSMLVFIFYYRVLSTYFLADDYNYVGHLLVNARDYVQGAQLAKWFIDFSAQGLQNPELSVFFRPVVQWLWLTDFIAWGTNPSGYHLTNIILHILNSFLVYLIATRVLHSHWGGMVAGVLFALHPIHADSVAWIPDRTDVLAAFFYFLSAVFFVYFRQKGRYLFCLLSVIAFALAIGTKENTVALPIILLVYDILFNRQSWSRIARAQILYWFVLVGYVALRFWSLGQFGRNTGGGFFSYGIELFAGFYTLAMAQPFFSDMNNSLMLIILGLVAVVMLIYHGRAPLWMGMMWIAISLLPSASAAYVAPRLAYTPSAGLAIAMAAIFLSPLPRQSNLSRALGTGLAAICVLAYGWGLALRVDDWVAAGTVAGAIPAETLRLHPTLSPDARLYYTGVPDILRNITIYNGNFGTAIQIAYKNPRLSVSRVEKFPILTADLDRTYFLEYSRRKITERDDLTRALQLREHCPGAQQTALNWDFSRENKEWQSWDQLTLLETRDGALDMLSRGDDPNFGGPIMSIPTLAIGNIEIEMSVRADIPVTQGAVFWMTTGQKDFSPAQQQTFDVQADGVFHTYRVDIAQVGNLMIGDSIIRLRLDPIHAPGEIALKAVRVNLYCSQIDGVTCKCQ